ncbi:MAG: hypothetical protein M1816_000708 [Peltula sp. TS41687]|nr:MAG: hypothetical protein M1816_000708 [Peltula sp. TS41687]
MSPLPPPYPSWNVVDLAIALRWEAVRDIVPVPEAPIPSPVAQWGSQTQEEECLALVAEIASPPVKKLFELVKTQRERYYLLRGVGPEEEAAGNEKVGIVAYMDEADTAEDGDGPRTDWDEPRPALHMKKVREWCVFRVDAKEPLYHLPPGTSTPVVSRLTTPIDIRRLDGATDDDRLTHGYFLVNLSKTTITVNKMGIRPNRIAGPLPEFAVMEVGEAAALWWHNMYSGDFIPLKRLKARSRQTEDMDPEPEAAVKTGDVPKQSKDG